MTVFRRGSWHALRCPRCGRVMLYATEEVFISLDDVDEKGDLRLDNMGLPFYVACPSCIEEQYSAEL